MPLSPRPNLVDDFLCFLGHFLVKQAADEDERFPQVENKKKKEKDEKEKAKAAEDATEAVDDNLSTYKEEEKATKDSTEVPSVASLEGQPLTFNTRLKVPPSDINPLSAYELEPIKASYAEETFTPTKSLNDKTEHNVTETMLVFPQHMVRSDHYYSTMNEAHKVDSKPSRQSEAEENKSVRGKFSSLLPKDSS